jgi:hypothetical protein
MWNLFQDTMPIDKPDCEDDGKLIFWYNNLVFKFNIVQSNT